MTTTEFNIKLRGLSFDDRVKLSEKLWPGSPLQSRRVMIGRWVNKGIRSLKLEQYRTLYNYFDDNNDK